MRILFFDCFSGISGDMTVGALLDLGVDINDLRAELAKLSISDEFSIEEEDVQNHGIRCKSFKVIVNNHEHNNEHAHVHTARTFADICNIIDESELKASIKTLSKNIFEEIAKAEAKVHGKEIDEIHFHEVGAVDSIVDIIGTAICIDWLEIDEVYSSTLCDGTGFVECQHGTLPVPVPAVAEMLNESMIPCISRDINTELITPTGLAIIKVFAKSFGRSPAMKIIKSGYGAGTRDTGSLNALRITLGESIEETAVDVTVIETNIDDATGEELSLAFDKLIEAGALDVFYTPIFMKKNRPAYKLSVICAPSEVQKFADIILAHTPAIGVRYYSAGRIVMDRETEEYETEFGPVRVKTTKYKDITKRKFEFDDTKNAQS
jgi:uncharacterized protein (TIGR00299 family) protein